MDSLLKPHIDDAWNALVLAHNVAENEGMHDTKATLEELVCRVSKIKQYVDDIAIRESTEVPY